MPDTDYENFMKMPISELASCAAGRGTGSKLELARLAYSHRMLQQQNEYAQQQIELQHDKNMKLIDRQLRWIKFSAILTAAATLAAVVLGWCLSELRSQQTQEVDKQQIVQPHTKASTSVPDPE
jgi:hypothetical protein